MAEWKKVRLGDIFNLQMGKTPNRKKLDYFQGSHKWISIADISKPEKYILETKERLTDEAITSSRIKSIPKDTVIMSFKLSIGKTAITSDEMYSNEAIMAFLPNGQYETDNVGRCCYFKDIGEPVYHNDHIIRVHFDENRLNEYYLNTALNSEYGKSEFKKYIKTSAGQYTIAQDGISSVQIYVPPLALQQRFAQFVQQIDKSKFIVEKSLEKAETLYKSLIQEYFG